MTLSIIRKGIQAVNGSFSTEIGVTLSELVEEYLKSITMEKFRSDQQVLGKIVKELKGSITLPKVSRACKEFLQDALVEKYLKRGD
jgi:histone H3/H4